MNGVDRIAAAFNRDDRSAALMPYMMACYPDPDGSIAIGKSYIESGADMIELGIPYSDPIADGPVIHAAGQQALERGATVDDALKVAEALAQDVPVVVMCYANIVAARGGPGFVATLAGIGVAGLIIPDQPVDESAALLEACDAHGLALIPLVAPTTTETRLSVIATAARGFVYAVSVAGVTGERDGIPPGVGEMVERTKSAIELPVAVGFGISTPEQAGEIAGFADGVIIGSRLVRAAGGKSGVSEVGEFLAEVSATLSN